MLKTTAYDTLWFLDIARMKTALTTLVQECITLLAPARCMRCLREDTWHCDVCRALYRPHTQSCVVCEEIHPSGRTCASCVDDTPLTGLLSAAPYTAPYIRRSIGWLKFKSIKGIAPSLALLTTPLLPRIAPLSVLQQHGLLVSIPLHTKRIRQRGFNQAAEISGAISNLTNIPTQALLTRSRHTHAQARLPKELRKENMEDAFGVIGAIPKETKYILLIDDVTTSGTTLSVAASTIQKNLPDFSGQIWGMSVARG